MDSLAEWRRKLANEPKIFKNSLLAGNLKWRPVRVGLYRQPRSRSSHVQKRFIGAHSPTDRFQGSAARTPPRIVSRLQFCSFEQSFPRLAGRGSRSKSKPQRRSSAPSIATFNLRRIRPPPLIQHRIWRRRPVSTRGLPKREDLPERTAGGTWRHLAPLPPT